MKTAKAKKLALTLCSDGTPDRPRWRKVYKKKTFYFRGTYGEALKAWELKKLQADGVLPESIQRAIADRKALAASLPEIEGGFTTNGQPYYADGRQGVQAMLAEDIAALERGEPVDAFALKMAQQFAPVPKKTGVTLGQIVGKFIAVIQSQHDDGKMVATHFDNVKRQALRFRDCIGADKPITAVNEEVFQITYKDHLRGLIKSRGWTAIYANAAMATALRLYKYAWKNRYVPELRLEAKDVSFVTAPKEVPIITPEEYRHYFEGTSEKTCLYVLLFLNCGMTGTDVATLTHSMLDLEKGTITRKRSKTKGFENVPTVTYYLWPKTLTLLKKFATAATAPNKLVLHNENGRPLITTSIDKGKLKKTDCFHLAFTRMCKRLKISAARMKDIRKTGATALGSNPKYASLSQYYLGHSPRTVADKHYVRPSDELFAEALLWLGKEFKIETL